MLGLVVVFGLILLSIAERVRLKVKAQSEFSDILADSKASMFSEAIANLIATAGGIYLSLVLLATFLGLELPSTVEFINLRFEPVAGTAILLALIQPFIQKVFELVFNRSSR